MQVSMETGEGLERRMKIDLPFEQIAGEVDKRLQALARSARLPGFRPGKVPLKLLRQRYGDQVEREVFGELAQSSFTEAVSSQSLRIAGVPQIEPNIDLAAKRFGFTAVFEVLPELELASLDGQVVKRPVAQITDADLEAVIQRLRTQRKTWEPVDRPARTGDRMTVSFVGTLDGEPFPGGTATGAHIELGSSGMIPGFEDGLAGASAGETRTLDLAFPEAYHAAHLAGRPVRFAVTVDQVAESKLPELDADFARGFGVADGDLERFRSDVRANMERELKQRIAARTKERAMDVLIAAHKVEVPAVLIAEEVRSLKEQMHQNLGGGRMELADALFQESARRRVALGLIVAEIVERNGLKPDPVRVRAAVEEMASTYEKPAEVIDYYYAERKRLAPVESLVLEQHVVDWVLGQVQVEDEETTFAQLTDSSAGI
jgi:trigger factor